MPSLADIQRTLAGAVRGEDDTPLAGLVAGHGLDPAQRVQIHRNTTHLTLTEALGANFPVVRALVGEAFFAQTARAYIRQTPPNSPVVSAYGDGLPDFLAGHEPARSLPYLPDVARLEWARLGALQAADAAPVAPATLGAVPPALVPMARCAVHPSFRCVVSPWPVDRIWAMHQPDWPEGETVSLDEGGATVLICRPRGQVLMARADRGTLSLLFALEMGQTLATAAQAAAHAAAHSARSTPDGAADGFDLTAALARLVSLGLLTEVAVPQTADGSTPCDPLMSRATPPPEPPSP
ncbi:DNA-binding domain-containing protein [Roseospira goensis]|uniref:Putative DNA-binding domain-containing protein n=1 Tax=Roseospira goensis TaxID=391922 RepID=A0A7W6S1F4_9PROT|nr:DNA-binding domain-containing protein [Roseospira goensis]MBB4287151.1 hypothetical protein [Roseospira goensis]